MPGKSPKISIAPRLLTLALCGLGMSCAKPARHGTLPRPVPSAQGTDISGGSSAVRLASGRVVLLDLYLESPQLESEDADPEVLRTLPRSAVPVSKVSARQLWRDTGFRTGPITRLTRDLEDKLAVWSAAESKHGLADQWRRALERLSFFYTYDPPHPAAHYFLPPEANVSSRQLETIAYFEPGFGPVLWAPLFAALGESSRSAVLAHEALRRLQAEAPGIIDDKTLQQLTAALVLRTPTRAHPTLASFTSLAHSSNWERHPLFLFGLDDFLREEAATLEAIAPKREHDACGIVHRLDRVATYFPYDELLVCDRWLRRTLLPRLEAAGKSKASMHALWVRAGLLEQHLASEIVRANVEIAPSLPLRLPPLTTEPPLEQP